MIVKVKSQISRNSATEQKCFHSEVLIVGMAFPLRPNKRLQLIP